MRPATCAGAILALTLAGAACGPPTSGIPVEELWSEHCQRCHGADGGGNPAQKGLDPEVDLLSSKMVANGTRGLIYQRIAYGYQAMPAFRHKLEQGDLEMLAQFVLDLKER